jgi:hypothetical protein
LKITFAPSAKVSTAPTSNPQAHYDQREQWTISSAKFEDFFPEKEIILQFRSCCSHITITYSLHEEMYMEFIELT